eukprot:gnl/Spiro4/225_TR130_c0_g2_i1.p1 gnl/Spiro4/225_TR130_c0_g2~~gnl/Spiro4/225_TR130_c0_g2_i1.p1  ORF type:complete len:729 (-),score=206.35 gnl/Spiro4/225_TR130_c0_g2_i1:186-2324(-)
MWKLLSFVFFVTSFCFAIAFKPGDIVAGRFEILERISRHPTTDASPSPSPRPGLSLLQVATVKLDWKQNLKNFDNAKELGQGSFGVVYRAHDKKRSNEVALKMFYYKPIESSDVIHYHTYATAVVSGALPKMVAEADNLQLVQTRGAGVFGADDRSTLFVRLIERHLEKKDPYMFLILEYCCDAVPMSEYFETLGGSEADYFHLKQLVFQMVLAVDYLSGYGLGEESPAFVPLIHHDWKPENLLVSVSKKTQEPALKVADFGAMLRCSKGDFQKSGTVGTKFYAPPEFPGKAFDYPCHSFDMWSVGTTILAALDDDIQARETYDIDESQTIEQLVALHRPDWADLAKRDEFYGFLAGLLSSMASGRVDPRDALFHRYLKDLTLRYLFQQDYSKVDNVILFSACFNGKIVFPVALTYSCKNKQSVVVYPIQEALLTDDCEQLLSVDPVLVDSGETSPLTDGSNTNFFLTAESSGTVRLGYVSGGEPSAQMDESPSQSAYARVEDKTNKVTFVVPRARSLMSYFSFKTAEELSLGTSSPKEQLVFDVPSAVGFQNGFVLIPSSDEFVDVLLENLKDLSVAFHVNSLAELQESINNHSDKSSLEAQEALEKFVKISEDFFPAKNPRRWLNKLLVAPRPVDYTILAYMYMSEALDKLLKTFPEDGWKTTRRKLKSVVKKNSLHTSDPPRTRKHGRASCDSAYYARPGLPSALARSC